MRSKVSEFLSPGAVRSLSLFITFFTGFTGLVYEVTWHRYLANFLGSQAQAAALILAVFLGGLCVGYLLFGKISQRLSPYGLVALCGWIEVGIGVWTLFFPELYDFVWQRGGILTQQSTSVFKDILTAVMFIGFPTVLMGATLPLLTQGLSKDLADASPFHARVYAVNTGGAFLGCLMSGFFFLPWWGLGGTMHRIAPINLIGGVALLIFARALSREPIQWSSTSEEVIDPDRHIHPAVAAIVALLSGFYSITLQVVCMRLTGLAMGASDFSFSMVVAVFICMLALGAWKLAGKTDERRTIPLWCNQLILTIGAFGVYMSAPYWGYYCHVVRTLFTSQGPSFYVYYASCFLLLSLVLLIPVGAMGSTMPLLFSAVKTRVDKLGEVVGNLYSINTVGCVLGALIGGYALLYSLDLDGVFKVCLVCMAITVFMVFPWTNSPLLFGRVPAATLFTGAMSVFMMLILFVPEWNKRFTAFGLFRRQTAGTYSYSGPHEYYERQYSGRRMVAYKDDPNSTVAVSEGDAAEEDRDLNSGSTIIRTVHVNGKSDGSTELLDTLTMRLSAHIPMLLSERVVESAAVVGFGLGITLGSITLYPEVKDVHIIEISPALKDFAHFFDFANYGASKNPKVHWSVGDAYRVLGGSDKKYNLIVSEPTNPWVAGVERLYAKEFYDVVKSRLHPGGIYTQWMYLYSVSEPTFGMVMNTFGNSFKYVRVFRTDSDVILIGSDEPIGKNSLIHMESRYHNLPEVRKALSQMHLHSPEVLLSLEEWLPTQAFSYAPLHTLEFPKLSFAAGRDFFMNARTSATEIAIRADMRPWVRKYSENSLINLWIKDRPKWSSILKYGSAACYRERTPQYADLQLKFFPGWWEEQPQCSESLVGLALANEIPPAEQMSQQILTLLQRSLKELDDSALKDMLERIGDELSIENANAFIEMFIQYDNVFMPISVERLNASAKPCIREDTQPAMICRAKYVEALARAGKGKQAQDRYQELLAPHLAKLPEGLPMILLPLIDSAKKAEELYPDAGQ